MNRRDRMVGIDGTAHGRMNSTDSHLIHERCWMKKPDRKSATSIFRLMPTSRKISVLNAAREHRVMIQRDVTCGVPGQPKSVADRIDHESGEHEEVRRQQREAPYLRG